MSPFFKVPKKWAPKKNWSASLETPKDWAIFVRDFEIRRYSRTRRVRPTGCPHTAPYGAVGQKIAPNEPLSSTLMAGGANWTRACDPARWGWWALGLAGPAAFIVCPLLSAGLISLAGERGSAEFLAGEFK